MNNDNMTSQNIELIRFNSTDGIELEGFLTNTKSNSIVIHLHGMSGNGYENKFLDVLRNKYTKKGVTFLTINTRGSGIISHFNVKDGANYITKKGGSCYEIFEECKYDIQGVINYVKDLGKSNIILQGHSLGCSKVVYYMTNAIEKEDKKLISKTILLAPTDVVSWMKLEENHEKYYRKAENLELENKGEELVDFKCGYFKTPISASSYISLSKPNSYVDIYSTERDSKSSLKKLECPSIIIYGDKDIGIIETDGNVNNYVERLNLVKNKNTYFKIIDGSNHGFRSFEKKLSDLLLNFIFD